MSMLIAYVDNDQSQRLHIQNYDKTIHKDKTFCAYGHQVVGKQGIKMTWHFAHVHAADSDCSRLMGDWHHWWQNRVYEDFLEIIMHRVKNEDGTYGPLLENIALPINDNIVSGVGVQPNLKKHIADMVNGENLIVEFQKSIIPQHIIIEREEFYGNMIWVFYCVEHEVKVIKQYGRYMRLQMTRGSKFFLDARKKSFLDFDKRGVLELIKVINANKAKPEFYVKIWTMAEFDDKYMRGCLKPEVDTRVHREPYQFDANNNNNEESFADIEKILREK